MEEWRAKIQTHDLPIKRHSPIHAKQACVLLLHSFTNWIVMVVKIFFDTQNEARSGGGGRGGGMVIEG